MTNGFIVQGRLQLRRVAEPRRALVHGGELVGLGVIQGIVNDPNNPALAYLAELARQARSSCVTSYTAQYFGWGGTTFSAFYDGHTNGNNSYLFAGDANGESVSGNDLIYIPRDTSEMNFKPLTVSGRTYTAADQAAAFEQLINADSYLKRAPRPVRRAQRRVPAVRQPDRREHHAGPVPQPRRPQALRRDPARHHELRQPAEQQVGRRPASGQQPDSDQPLG